MRNGNVLVVEDDDIVRRLLIDYLKSHEPIEVHGARDGVEALHLIVTNRYAVMILDVMMPKMSGVDVLVSLHALTSDPSVKALDDPLAVLVITAADEVALPDDALVQRYPRMVHGVFRKPLDVAALAARVETYLRA